MGRWAGVDSAWEREKPEVSLSCRFEPAAAVPGTNGGGLPRKNA